MLFYVNNKLTLVNVMLIDYHLYVFYLKEYDYDDMNVITIVSKVKQPFPCVQLFIPNYPDSSASIQSLNYYQTCSVNEKLLDKKNGTVIMIQIALHYAKMKYPYIKEFQLQDETHIDISAMEKPLITSRRLLEGRLGWYEEYLNAIPIQGTKLLIKYIRDVKIQSYIKGLLSSESSNPLWWTPSNIIKITSILNKELPERYKHTLNINREIFGTTWSIPVEEIPNIKYTIDETQDGGSHIDKLMKKGRRYYVNRHLMA